VTLKFAPIVTLQKLLKMEKRKPKNSNISVRIATKGF
jgi:hypothetical protein